MLKHINMHDSASLIENAFLKTIEDGIHTADMYNDNLSKQKVSTNEFTDAVIERLGAKSSSLYNASGEILSKSKSGFELSANTASSERDLVGIDLYINFQYDNIEQLVELLKEGAIDQNLQLQMISSRGLQVWPINVNENENSDISRCRFVSKKESKEVVNQDILSLLTLCYDKDIDVVKTENLYLYDGMIGFSLSQGQ